MSFLDIFKKPYPRENAAEVESLTEELIRIGIQDDYLSERPGYGFNGQCRHIRARAIGTQLQQVGGNDLMSWAYRKVRKQAGKILASHLEYAWKDIGDWQP